MLRKRSRGVSAAASEILGEGKLRERELEGERLALMPYVTLAAILPLGFSPDQKAPVSRGDRSRQPALCRGRVSFSATTHAMNLPVNPPLPPMLARLQRELPGDALYEPKWDGFRCLAFCEEGDVDLRSRNDRPLARYFPELVEALVVALPEQRIVLDGEVMVATPDGFDFTALLGRLHPAKSRIERLSRETPASFVAFDVLACADEDFRGLPFAERRAHLERVFAATGAPLFLTPITSDSRAAARWLDVRNGIDGVVARDPAGVYRPGERALVKVKRERTADCVVAGFRLFEDRPLPSSLLLGVYDDAGDLSHVGLASSFAEAQRPGLLETLSPLAIPLERHPWRNGFLLGGSPMGRMKGAAGRWTPEMRLDWIPLEPTLVCEVAYEHLDDDRFRHPARFRRFRPDRDARSCTFDQFERSEGAAHILAA
jgi:ATP-dependent DNA ligase